MNQNRADFLQHNRRILKKNSRIHHRKDERRRIHHRRLYGCQPPVAIGRGHNNNCRNNGSSRAKFQRSCTTGRSKTPFKSRGAVVRQQHGGKKVVLGQIPLRFSRVADEGARQIEHRLHWQHGLFDAVLQRPFSFFSDRARPEGRHGNGSVSKDALRFWIR